MNHTYIYIIYLFVYLFTSPIAINDSFLLQWINLVNFGSSQIPMKVFQDNFRSRWSVWWFRILLSTWILVTEFTWIYLEMMVIVDEKGRKKPKLDLKGRTWRCRISESYQKLGCIYKLHQQGSDFGSILFPPDLPHVPDVLQMGHAGIGSSVWW